MVLDTQDSESGHTQGIEADQEEACTEHTAMKVVEGTARSLRMARNHQEPN